MQQDYLIVSVLFLILANYILFSIIYSVQSKPFIDEIFHVPQTIKYCQGQFDKWDSKITTLPGLYYISVGVLMPMSAISGVDLCSVYGLRAVNVAVSVVNFYLLYVITKLLHPDLEKKAYWMVLTTALNLTILPPLYFFSFLYYTDIVSTNLVLMCYVLHLQHKPWLAATAGLMSVMTRQTNIVWVAFFASETVVDFIKDEAVLYRKKKITSAVESSTKYLQILNFAVTNLWKQGSFKVGVFVGKVLAAVIGYITVGLIFLAFVIYNGGIVVGDKSAHSATVHIPQVLYFSLVASVFSYSHFMSKSRQFFDVVRNYRLFSLTVTGLCFMAVHLNSMAHPYLLADNRHYTFYLWRRVLSQELLRNLIIPWYLYSLYCIQDSIKHRSITFQIGYWTCVLITVVPQKLLELRYFILPYLIFRLQMKPAASGWPLVMESVLSIAINIITVYLFVAKTFYWSDSPEPQRIIW